ncbi:hypothetical protein K445DRAFT_8792 [Daldinia sp. EC12]|nr:hypothetical protein K445DRAFT_8792 [Daldinia sp. EC12]
MVDLQNPAVTHHAILIGINSYNDKPLDGCVRDVEEIKKYLEKKSSSIHIDMFTAPSNNDPGLTKQEDPETLPTYENVTNAIGRTIGTGNRGDYVYIHFSGHGTRGTPSSEFSNRSTGDLALVLLSSTKDNGVRYLWGSRLAFSIKAMVDKGLVVTLVLDCCFAATVYRRDDPNLRCLQFDPKVDSMYPSDNLSRGPDPGDITLTDRDSSMLPNWLVNPNCYAILAACGPHESAVERNFNNGPKHGALSYFLLTTLKRYDAIETAHSDIYKTICILFSEYRLRQHPILYGNRSQGFLGFTSSQFNSTIPILQRDDGRLELQAGLAHGILEGDNFALWPSVSSRSEKGTLVVSKVVHAGGLVSNLERLETSYDRPRTGWIATALTRNSLKQFPIGLHSSLRNKHKLTKELQRRSLEVSIAADNNCSFHIVINDNGNYEILDGSKRVINLPILLPNGTEDNKVCDILEHLASYNLVQELVNSIENSSFRECFQAQLINCNGKHFDPGVLIDIKQGQSSKFNFELQVKNKGAGNIYVYVYNLGPYKQVQNILCGTYEVVYGVNCAASLTPIFRKKLKTTIPSEMIEKGHTYCEDVIKVFITSQPASFDIFELGKIGSELRQKRSTTRTGQDDSLCSSHWSTLNFYIRTSV